MTQEHRQNLGEKAQARVVRMPTREEILKRFPAETLGIDPVTDDFYTSFVISIADSDITGLGLYLAWDSDIDHTLGAYPAITRDIVNMTFDRVVDAITPDPEVAEQAKEFRNKELMEPVGKKIVMDRILTIKKIDITIQS